jgi:hypothetical protein
LAIPAIIVELVERFTRNRASYTASDYNEAQLRCAFLDPFFEALGWDMQNTLGYAEAYKDVVNEDAIKIGGSTKAPDYAFRIGGTRKFFVEAKKPAVRIRDDASPAYQLRRYAWSAKLPLSILTDFEELAVYDCRIKPDHADSAGVARVMLIPYTEYPARWDEIASIFSREAILKGSFDKYAESATSKRGTAEVDSAFLQQIEHWREDLAHNLALRNPNLTVRELNSAVQRTIDRLIFLRICEDRGIEDPDRLRALTNGLHIYGRLCDLFKQADMRYNSGLFHFQGEEDREEAPDTLTLGLSIDDKLLRDLIKGMYYPDSPYEFSVLPADILGHVYEQFLGKVIRLTPGHQAKIEEKPEVRKAGGVYYTPTYIVDYIVRQTVGRLVEGKTPRQIAGGYDGHPLRTLDPACGSGSFLIGAYQFLLDWHRDWYLANLVPLLEAGKAADAPEVRDLLPVRPTTKRGRRAANGNTALPVYLVQREGMAADWRLTTAERKRILLAHIFGVDIDAQAVEVTKMSLLLKVLEGENEQTLSQQLALFQERALPDLGANIQCGNSLVGPDFYDNQQMALLPADDQYRINVFDWQAGFPQVFGSHTPGFDAVIGNPPYIRIQTMKEWAPQEVEYYKRRYTSASKGNYDIYVVFVEKGLILLTDHGQLGFILPHKFFNAQYGEPLRALIAEGGHLRHIVHFGSLQVFRGATTYTCLLFLNRVSQSEFDMVKVHDLAGWRTGGCGIEGSIRANEVTKSEWNFVAGDQSELVARLRQFSVRLGDIADVFVGLQTSADDVFIMNWVETTSTGVRLFSKHLGQTWDFESNLLFPVVSGTDVGRYRPLPARQYILFPYQVDNEQATLIPLATLKRDYPKTAEYLSRSQKRLEARERGRFAGEGWHRFGRSQNLGIQNRKKLCVPRLVDRLHAAFDTAGDHFLDNVDVGGVTLKPEATSVSLPYLLGLLNSSLIAWYFPYVSAPFRGGWLSANRQFLSQLPIRTIDLSIPADQSRHDDVVQLVQRVLALHRQLAEARTDQERMVLERQIAVTDHQIDQLVYELYGLTAEEISIVESSS